ncbi:11242_t:CDS:2 [Funneliformis geosporum]|uniref:11242_t:CDS:1 n=1 Tax=Funneliformis geosporum TaxID=1117311 RepID=A0A9W4T4Y4_9GLOM|nr:11242_t:CDS:2 [Funneliformis geosporum]
MGNLCRLGWQCNRNEIKTSTPTAEGDSHTVADKKNEDIAESRRYNVLTEEKGLMVARANAKSRVEPEEKPIFDHKLLDSADAINATEALLRLIKKASEITTATANQAQTLLILLHDAREKAIEKDTEGNPWNPELSPSELKLFAATYLNEEEEETPLEEHCLVELDTAEKVQMVHRMLTVLQIGGDQISVADIIDRKTGGKVDELREDTEWLEAKKVYRDALQTPLPDFPYSSILSTIQDRDKIFYTKRKEDIPNSQREVS